MLKWYRRASLTQSGTLELSRLTRTHCEGVWHGTDRDVLYATPTFHCSNRVKGLTLTHFKIINNRR